jgi:hypothetical protein
MTKIQGVPACFVELQTPAQGFPMLKLIRSRDPGTIVYEPVPQIERRKL